MKRKLKRILRTVARFYTLSPADIIKKDRHGLEVKARQMYFYICRRLGYSYDESARFVKRDRTTAIYHFYKIRDEVDKKEFLLYNEETDNIVQHLLNKCDRWTKI